MHEYAICMALLEQVERIAREHNAQKVERIILKVGPLSGVEGELLQHSWPLAAADTIAAEARLTIEPAPVVIKCSRCESEAETAPNRLLCPSCGSFQTRLIGGDEMLLESIELLTNDS